MCCPPIFCFSCAHNIAMLGLIAMVRNFALLAHLVSFFLLGFLLIGSSSSNGAITAIYLIRLTYNTSSASADALMAAYSNETDTTLTVKANYLGLCASTESGGTVCTSSHNLAAVEEATGSTGAVNLFAIVEGLRLICYPWVLVATLVIILLVIVVELYHVMPFVPGRYMARKVCLGATALTVMVWGIGAMLQHQAVKGAKAFVDAATDDYIEVKVGTRAEAMLWAAFLLLILATLASCFRVYQDHRRQQKEAAETNETKV